ncbi:MAG: ABC transporter ATP-binding protein [Eubacteriales bacterium]
MKKLLQTLQKVIYILDRKQKAVAILVLVLSVLGSVLEMLGVSSIVPLVTVILDPDAVQNNAIVQSIVFLQERTYQELVLVIGGGVVLLYMIKNIYFIVLSYVRVKFTCKIKRELSIRMMNVYMQRGYQFFLGRNYGQLTRGIDGDASSLQTFLSSALKFAMEILSALLIFLYMCYSDWQMALAMIVLSAVCLVIINTFFRKRMYQVGIEQRKYGSKSNQALLQALQGIKEVLIMQKQKHFVKRYEDAQVQLQLQTVKQTVGGESPAYVVEGICVSGLMVIVCLRVVTMDNPIELMATLSGFVMGAFRVLPSLGKIASLLNILTNSIASVDAYYEKVKEVEQYQNEIANEDTHLLEGMDTTKGTISVENITFSYENTDTPVLCNASLTVEVGQAVGIIGESGSGKSTLADIMLGLLKPQEGEVLFNHVNIHQMPFEWSRLVGYVPQSVYLIDDSIANNIAFGENGVDQERLEEAIQKAKLKEFVDSLPKGTDTIVGDRGVRLSGGQRQRIAIARALYREPKILILDEATSALDNDTEQAIMEAIDSLQGEVTLLIIAHRLTTIKKCDIICEVVDHEIVHRNKEEVV